MKPQPINVDKEFEKAPSDWLAKQAKRYQSDLSPKDSKPVTVFLLAHTEAGVIWGKYDGDALALSSDVFKPSDPIKQMNLELNKKTLHAVRLFGLAGELFVWKTDVGFSGRLIADSAAKSDDIVEEAQWLWGVGGKAQAGFTPMNEGQQGLRHTPPLDNVEGKRLALCVRHYITEDDQGRAYIGWSRLVNLEVTKGV